MLNSTINNKYITAPKKNPDKVVDFIKKSINKSKNSNMTFDISGLNLMDASKVATLASTYHFIKFNSGSINWIVNSKDIESILSPMNLGNCNFVCA